jgi:hypothetical protein
MTATPTTPLRRACWAWLIAGPLLAAAVPTLAQTAGPATAPPAPAPAAPGPGAGHGHHHGAGHGHHHGAGHGHHHGMGHGHGHGHGENHAHNHNHGKAHGMQGWRMNRDNTPGWSLMTPEERAEHHRTMMGMAHRGPCQAYRAQHHAEMVERAKRRGHTPPGMPRHDACMRLPA